MEEYVPVDIDMTDPDFLASLNEYVPDINMDAAPEAMTAPAPPSDGVYAIKVRPNRRRQGDPVYYKDLVKDPRTGKIVGGKVIAALVARTFDVEENKEGAFLKDYYASSVAFGPEKGSSLTFIAKQAGQRVNDGSALPVIKNAIDEALAMNEEDGILLYARTRWVKSAPRVAEVQEGVWLYQFDEKGFKIYDEVKGEAKIKALSIGEAQAEVSTWKRDDDESFAEFEIRKAYHVESAPLRAHLFYDPVAQRELRVSAEIAELLDPRKLGVK
jgi:hypothetical protein